MSTLEVVQDNIVDKFGVDRASLAPDRALDQLGIDSLAVLEILFDIEDRFGIKIEEDVPTTLATLQDVVVYIDTVVRARRSQPPVAAPRSPLE